MLNYQHRQIFIFISSWILFGVFLTWSQLKRGPILINNTIRFPEEFNFAPKKSPCSGNWDATKNVWVIETQEKDKIAPLIQCTLESFAEKMPQSCIRLVKSTIFRKLEKIHSAVGLVN